MTETDRLFQMAYDQMDELWAGWLAGIVDGEGCICIGKTKTSYRVFVSITNTNRDILNKVIKIVGTGKLVELPRSEAHHKPAWKVSYDNAADVDALLFLIDPFLIGKRKQLRNAQIFLQTIGNGRITEKTAELREKLYLDNKELNRRGILVLEEV